MRHTVMNQSNRKQDGISRMVFVRLSVSSASLVAYCTWEWVVCPAWTGSSLLSSSPFGCLFSGPLPHHLFSRCCNSLLFFFSPPFCWGFSVLPLKLNAPLLRRFRQALPARFEALITFQIKVSSVSVLGGAFSHSFFFFFLVLSEDAYVRDMVFSTFSYCKQPLC